MTGTDRACLSALLTGTDWTVRDDRITTLDGRVSVEATDRGWVAIEFADPIGQQPVRVVVDRGWSFGMVADLAEHIRMIVRVTSLVREGD